MIKIETKNTNGDKFKSQINVTGSANEVTRDFYSLHDLLQRDSKIRLLYAIAIKNWESNHENN